MSRHDPVKNAAAATVVAVAAGFTPTNSATIGAATYVAQRLARRWVNGGSPNGSRAAVLGTTTTMAQSANPYETRAKEEDVYNEVWEFAYNPKKKDGTRSVKGGKSGCNCVQFVHHLTTGGRLDWTLDQRRAFVQYLFSLPGLGSLCLPASTKPIVKDAFFRDGHSFFGFRDLMKELFPGETLDQFEYPFGAPLTPDGGVAYKWDETSEDNKQANANNAAYVKRVLEAGAREVPSTPTRNRTATNTLNQGIMGTPFLSQTQQQPAATPYNTWAKRYNAFGNSSIHESKDAQQLLSELNSLGDSVPVEFRRNAKTWLEGVIQRDAWRQQYDAIKGSNVDVAVLDQLYASLNSTQPGYEALRLDLNTRRTVKFISDAEDACLANERAKDSLSGAFARFASTEQTVLNRFAANALPPMVSTALGDFAANINHWFDASKPHDILTMCRLVQLTSMMHAKTIRTRVGQEMTQLCQKTLTGVDKMDTAALEALLNALNMKVATPPQEYTTLVEAVQNRLKELNPGFLARAWSAISTAGEQIGDQIDLAVNNPEVGDRYAGLDDDAPPPRVQHNERRLRLLLAMS